MKVDLRLGDAGGSPRDHRGGDWGGLGGTTSPEHSSLQELEEAAKLLPLSLQRQHGLADTLMADSDLRTHATLNCCHFQPLWFGVTALGNSCHALRTRKRA